MYSVIYIPGMGGEKLISRQKRFVRLLNGIRPENKKIAFFDTQWEYGDPETYTEKFERLRNFYEDAGKPYHVWAVSAGASLAVRLCTELNSTTHLHNVCGKVFDATTIGQHYRDRSYPFYEPVAYNDANDLGHHTPVSTTSYIPKDNADGVIDTEEMRIPNRDVIDLPSLPHGRAIGYALVRYLPFI